MSDLGMTASTRYMIQAGALENIPEEDSETESLVGDIEGDQRMEEQQQEQIVEAPVDSVTSSFQDNFTESADEPQNSITDVQGGLGAPLDEAPLISWAEQMEQEERELEAARARQTDVHLVMERVKDLVQRLRRERVNVREHLNLEQLSRCVYSSLGCELSRPNSAQFAAHMDSCDYGRFSRCLFEGCSGGADVAFQTLEEFATHNILMHEDNVHVFTSPGISAGVEIPRRLLETEFPDVLKLVGITKFDQDNVKTYILTFVRVFRCDNLDYLILAPFSLCSSVQHDQNGFQLTPAIDVKYRVSSGREILFKTYPTLHEGYMSASVYPSLKAYLEDRRRNNHLFVDLRDLSRVVTLIRRREAFLSFTIGAAFTATRVATKCLDLFTSSWLWSWKHMFRYSDNKVDFFAHLERKGFKNPEKMLKAVATAAYKKVELVVEATDNDQVLIGLLMKELAGIFERIQTPPQNEPEPRRLSKHPARKIPKMERIQKELGKPVKSRGPPIKAISPPIIIVADSDVACARIKTRLLAWFPQMVVILGHEMKHQDVRKAAMRDCHVFVATMYKFQYHLEVTGVYLVGSRTKVVLAYHCDRLMSDDGVEDVVHFYFPTLNEEFRASRKILWTNKLLMEQEQAIRENYWPDKDFGILSIGAVGVMGLSPNLQFDPVPVDWDNQKGPVIANFVRRHQDTFKQMVVICKARNGVDIAEETVKSAVDTGVEVLQITKEHQCHPDIQGIIERFFARNERAILVMSPAILGNIDFPKVEAVLIDGLLANFVEFYRSLEIAKDLVVAIRVRSYSLDGGFEYQTFLRDFGVIDN